MSKTHQPVVRALLRAGVRTLLAGCTYMCRTYDLSPEIIRDWYTNRLVPPPGSLDST